MNHFFKKATNRWGIAIGVIFLCIAMLFWTIITGGYNYSADGLEQNTRFSIENARYENGVFHYTVVNRTRYELRTGSRPQIDRKVDGEWENLYYYESKQAHTLVFPPFSEGSKQSAVDAGILIPTGEYRVVVHTQRFSAVGYFTVTEAVIV